MPAVESQVSEAMKLCRPQGLERAAGSSGVSGIKAKSSEREKNHLHRFFRSLPMLRGLIFCLSLLSIRHAADDASRCFGQSSQRGAPRVLPVEVVCSDSKALGGEEGAFFDVSANELGSCAGSQLPSQGRNQYGRWKKCLDCQAQISFDRWGPDNPRPTSKKSKAAPANIEISSQAHQGARCSDEVQGEASHRGSDVSCRASECLESTLSGADVQSEPDPHSTDPGPDDVAGAGGLHDVEHPGDGKPPNIDEHPDAHRPSEPGALSDSGGDGRRHAESQRRGLGKIQLSRRPSLMSKVLKDHLPSEVLEELQQDDWLVQPFQFSLCTNPIVQNSDCFLWHPSNEHQVFLVSRAPGVVFDLKNGDVLDDHEFFSDEQAEEIHQESSQ
eukprot:s1981_g4.t1